MFWQQLHKAVSGYNELRGTSCAMWVPYNTSLLCGYDEGLAAVHQPSLEDSQALNQAGQVGSGFESCQLTACPLSLKPGGVAHSLHSAGFDDTVITQHLSTAGSRQGFQTEKSNWYIKLKNQTAKTD